MTFSGSNVLKHFNLQIKNRGILDKKEKKLRKRVKKKGCKTKKGI